MATYKLFDGQTITADYIFYVDPSNGDDSNDGLTPETAIKNPKNAVSGGDSVIFAFVKGEHAFAPTEAPYFTHASFTNLYFVANPRTTKLLIDVTNTAISDTGNGATQRCHLFKHTKNVVAASTTLIGLDIEVFGKNFGVFDGAMPNNSSGTVNGVGNVYKVFNCRIYAITGTAFQQSIMYMVPNASVFRNTILKRTNTGGVFSIYQSYAGYGYFNFYNCAILNVSTVDHCVGTWRPTMTDCLIDAGVEDDRGHLTLSGDNKDSFGVYSGTYDWRLFKYRSNFYLRDSNGDYYRIEDEVLVPVAELAEEDGLEPYISTADMELIRTLDNPVLVGFGAETVNYKAILIDDIQLLTPTGDIDLSLASAINSFVFTDAGDVRRLLSVDRGTTWQYWDSDNAEFAEYTGDISNKAGIYAVANSTADLNALTAAQIATIIPPESVDKHIRFLTVLRQESLGEDTRTLSVGIDNARRGYFKSVPISNFEETLYTGSLQIKYVGADAIAELHLLLAV